MQGALPLGKEDERSIKMLPYRERDFEAALVVSGNAQAYHVAATHTLALPGCTSICIPARHCTKCCCCHTAAFEHRRKRRLKPAGLATSGKSSG